MDHQRDAACQNGLRFFGKISASISHEIKNALAVISESAGLAEDLLSVADGARPVDETRLKKSVQRIRARVEDADGIIKNMNAFAHSIDEPVRRVDVVRIIELIAALTKRLLHMRGISLKVDPPSDTLVVNTAPFYLENLAWLLLEFSMENRGSSDTLNLKVEKTGAGVELCFSGLDGLDQTPTGCIPSESMQSLLKVLEAELEWNIEKRALVLKLSDLSGPGRDRSAE